MDVEEFILLSNLVLQSGLIPLQKGRGVGEGRIGFTSVIALHCSSWNPHVLGKNNDS